MSEKKIANKLQNDETSATQMSLYHYSNLAFKRKCDLDSTLIWKKMSPDF